LERNIRITGSVRGPHAGQPLAPHRGSKRVDFVIITATEFSWKLLPNSAVIVDSFRGYSVKKMSRFRYQNQFRNVILKCKVLIHWTDIDLTAYSLDYIQKVTVAATLHSGKTETWFLFLDQNTQV
jgi:hypothetical protein